METYWIFIQSYARRKSKREFGSLVCVQTIDVHNGAIWTMKFRYSFFIHHSSFLSSFFYIYFIHEVSVFFCRSFIDLFFSYDGLLMASGGQDGLLRLWRVNTDSNPHTYLSITLFLSPSLYHPLSKCSHTNIRFPIFSSFIQNYLQTNQRSGTSRNHMHIYSRDTVAIF